MLVSELYKTFMNIHEQEKSGNTADMYSGLSTICEGEVFLVEIQTAEAVAIQRSPCNAEQHGMTQGHISFAK